MIRRVFGLAVLLGVAGCSSAPEQIFPPLNYSYLPPITLNVATVNVVNSYAADPGAMQLISEDPAPPPAVLATELARRLIPGGAPGTATVTIEAASIDQVNDSLVGAMSVRIDVASADGLRTGYTEASVQQTAPAPDSDAGQNQVQAALYGMTKQLMDAMNVQLQYQLQANLPSWIVAAPGAGGGFAPAPVTSTIQAAPLPAPTAVPGAPATAISPPVPSLVPPSFAAPQAAPPAPPLVLPPAPPASGLPPPQQLVPY